MLNSNPWRWALASALATVPVVSSLGTGPNADPNTTPPATPPSFERSDPNFITIPEFASDGNREYVDRLRKHFADIATRIRQETGGTIDFQIAGRWPGNMTDPISLTWSFMPDGTPVIDELGNSLDSSGQPILSNLFAVMNNKFGAGSPQSWIATFQAMFDRWDQLSGVSFQRIVVANEADDGAPWGSDGVPGARGDIRIGMTFLDGPSTQPWGGLLAFAQEPQLPSPGDIIFDSAEAWNNPLWTTPAGYAFANAVGHEIGHALGLDHVCPTTTGTKLMEGLISPNMNYWGPQHDDLRGSHSLYGDPMEPNDTRFTATQLYLPPFGTYVNYGDIDEPYGPFGPSPVSSGLFSIDAPDDVDYYTFTIHSPTQPLFVVSPIGLVYASYPETCGPVSNPFQCCPGLPNEASQAITDLVVEILDRNLKLVLTQTTGAGNPVYLNPNLPYVDVPYYIRVRPVHNGPGAFPSPQCYDIAVEPLEGQGCNPANPLGSCSDGIDGNGVEVCGVDQACHVSPLKADCNGNWWEDAWDISSGASKDCDHDGVPDECQNDCNGNGVADRCDIISHTSLDCDHNSIPDECEEDCNGNGIVDACDISSGQSPDSNSNGVPDGCESTLLVPSQFTTIGDALMHANNGDTILIAPGTYTGAANRNLLVIDKTVQIVSSGGPYVTTIDLQSLGRFAYFGSINKKNRSTVRGLTIQNGNANAAGGNYRPGYGGTIYVDDADLVIDRCILRTSSAAFGGGAVAYRGDGVGVVLTRMHSTICWGNTASLGGAVFFESETYPTIICSTFSANTATSGGAVYSSAGVHNFGGVIASIVLGNTPLADEIYDGDASMLVKYCDMGTAEVSRYTQFPGNISVDPLFRNVATNDYRIKRNSLCRNAGDPFYTPLFSGLDVEGEPRLNQGLVDIGADEVHVAP